VPACPPAGPVPAAGTAAAAGCYRQRLGQQRAAGQMTLRRLTAQLDQRERVTAGLGDQPAAMPSSGRPPATKASRARASRPGSSGQEQFGQRVQGQPPPGGLPHREQPGDALGVDPARHSCEDFRRDGIQPLCVVHGDELRPPGAPAPSLAGWHE
jgi:hypothetical protein